MLVLASFIGASVGIIIMILFSPVLVEVAFKFGPAEYFSMMMLGLFAGATLAKGSAIKGVAMVFLGLLIGVVGTDVNTGTIRYAFGVIELSDGVQLVALAMGLFGLADFFANVNRIGKATTVGSSAKMSVRPEPGDIKQSAMPIARGSAIGAILGIDVYKRQVSSGMRRSAATSCGSFGAQSWPLRVYRRTSPWSSRASNR